MALFAQLLTRVLMAVVIAAVSLPASVMGPATSPFAPAPVAAQTLAVNSLIDEPDAAPGDGLCFSAPSGLCTLRAAVMEANILPGADTITVPTGVFTLTQTGVEDLALTGDLDILSDLVITGTGATSTIIEACNGAGCVGIDRVFDIHSGVVNISNVTVQNGRLTAAFDVGGGIQVRVGATLTLNNAVVSNNASAAGDGGGVYNNGALTVTASTIIGNFAGFNGGGIRSDTNATITNTTILANFAVVAGGGVRAAGGLTLASSTISNNVAGNLAGGVHSLGATGVTNTTVSSNTASVNGGGIVTDSGALDLRSSTVANNVSPAAGGIITAAGFATAVTNSIIANANANCAGGGAFVSNGANLSSDATCPFAAAGDLPANTNPLIGPLGNSGGVTPTHALLSGSPAINAGASGINCPAADQRGRGRPEGAACDIGAFELEMPTKLVVTASSGVAATVPFEVTVTAQDPAGTPRGVALPTGIELTVVSGTGVLHGALSAILPAGDSTVTLRVSYTEAESNVRLRSTRTSGDNLTAGESGAFTVGSAPRSGGSSPAPPPGPPPTTNVGVFDTSAGGMVTTANAAVLAPAGVLRQPGLMVVTVSELETGGLPPARGILLGSRIVDVTGMDAAGQVVHALDNAVTLIVKITAADLALAGGEPARLRLMRVDEATGGLIDLGGMVDSAGMTITVAVAHFSRFVLAAPQPAPAASTPENGAVVVGMNPVLAWTLPAGTRQYHVQVLPVNNDGPGLNLIVGAPELVALGRYAMDPPVLGAGNYLLLPGMTYIWRVRATSSSTALGEDGAGWSDWSPGRHFRTSPPTSATIRAVSPAALATVESRTPTLRWSNANGAIFYYEVQLSRDQTFETEPEKATAAVYWEIIHGGITTPLNSYRLPQGLELEGRQTYFWRVRPRVQGDGSPVDWSETFTFRTP